MRRPHSALDLLGGPLGGCNRGDLLVHCQILSAKSSNCERLENPNLHSRQATCVDESSIGFQERSEVIQTRVYIMMRVRSVSRLLEWFTTDDCVISKIRMRACKIAQPAVVEQVGSIRSAHHQMNFALAWARPLRVSGRAGGRPNKQLVNHSTEWSDACSCCHKNIIMI